MARSPEPVLDPFVAAVPIGLLGSSMAGPALEYVAYFLFLRGYPREAVAERDRRPAPLRALGVAGVFGMMVAGFWVAYRIDMSVR